MTWEEEKENIKRDFREALRNANYMRVSLMVYRYEDLVCPNANYKTLMSRISDYSNACMQLALECGMNIDQYDKYNDHEWRKEEHYLEMHYPSWNNKYCAIEE